jgi:hypothetical protein
MSSEFSEALAPWIAERVAAREADWRKRRESKAAFRAERKTARDAGLIQRYALKEARIQQGPSIT